MSDKSLFNKITEFPPLLVNIISKGVSFYTNINSAPSMTSQMDNHYSSSSVVKLYSSYNPTLQL